MGANATLVDSFDVPNGSYDRVFLYVSDVEGVLKSGNETRVKLPSEKFQIDEGFTIGPNASVDFVFDVTVHRAGKSGKHILKPVVGQSGTDVPIESVDGEDDEEGENDESEPDEEGTEGDDESDQGEGSPGEQGSALNATFAGPVTPGENATLVVTDDGTPVANATVTVNDERVGTTDDSGRITVPVPAVDELELEVTAGDREGELELELGDDTDDGGGGEGNADDGQGEEK